VARSAKHKRESPIIQVLLFMILFLLVVV